MVQKAQLPVSVSVEGISLQDGQDCTIKSNNSHIGVGSVVNWGTQSSTPSW
jgi:hypothetical protein